MRRHIIEVDVLVAPLEVVDYALICQLFLYYENVLEEIDNSLLDVEMVKLRNHGFLVFQVSFVLVDQSIPLINYISDVVEDSAVCAHIELCQLLRQILVLLLLPLELIVHVLDLYEISLQLPYDQLLVNAPAESFLDLREPHGDIGQLLDVCLRVLGSIEQSLGLLLQHVNFVFEYTDLILEVRFVQFIDIDYVVVSMLADGAPEADTAGAVLAEAFHVLAVMVVTAENVQARLLLLRGHSCVGDPSSWY